MKGTGMSVPCGFRPLLFLCAFLSAVFLFGMQKLSAQEASVFQNGGLRRFIDDEGSFFTDSVQSRTLRSADGILVQKQFDSLKRLVQKIVWNMAQTEPLSVIDYSYEGESPFPVSAVTTDNEKKCIIHERFTEAGLPAVREIYTVTDGTSAEGKDAEGKKDKAGKVPAPSPSESEKNTRPKSDKILFSTETFRYDEDKRLIEEIIEYAAVSAGDTKFLGQKRTVSDTKRIEKKAYRYAEGGSSPDEFYYRNSDKIRQKIYSSPDDWEETVFFAGGTRIVKLYKNEIPVSETVYENGIKKRERAL